MIEFRAINHFYNKNQILKNFCLKLKSHKVNSLLGPSGSGKTTVLRLACGLEHIQDGSIRFDDKIITKNSESLMPEKRNIGYVFQDCALFPHLTVEENILFSFKKFDVTSKDKIYKLLKKNDFIKFVNRYPHELSGGQKQLVALFRAIAKEPKLILMDEPFSSLDTRLREKIRDQILHILSDNQITTLLVTHDSEEAMFMSDNIAILKNGSIEQVGTPLELYRSPKSKFVTEFFGEVNVFEGNVNKGILKTVIGNFEINSNKFKKKMMLVVRNEGFIILNDIDDKNEILKSNQKNIIKCPKKGKIIESKYLGNNTLIHISITNDNHHFHIKIPGINYFKKNQIVNIFTNTDYSYIFNYEI